jgi:hypothetical protein
LPAQSFGWRRGEGGRRGGEVLSDLHEIVHVELCAVVVQLPPVVPEILKLIRDSLLTGEEIQRLISYLSGYVTDADIEAMQKADDDAKKREEDALKRAKEKYS